MSGTVQRRLTYRIRRAVGPWVDRVARRFVGATDHVFPEEYAATVECSVADLESRLSEHGFRWNPLSMYHRAQFGNRSNGSWVLRQGLFSDRQLHVILIKQGEAQVDVYAHDEYSWLRHPIKHAEQVDMRREEGANQALRHLDAMAVDYVRESTVRRRAAHLGRRVRKRLSARSPN